MYFLFKSLDLFFNNLASSSNPMEISQDLIDDLARRFARLDIQDKIYVPPISKMPNEILIEIFLVLKSIAPALQWFKVNLVCRRWRRVAIGTPELWTSVATNLQLARLMLYRSEPFGIEVDLTCKSDRPFTSAIMKAIGRVTNLKVTTQCKGQDILRQVLLEGGQCGRRASVLKKLNISGEPNPPSPNLQLSSKFFGPKNLLHTLKLTGIDFDWDIFPFPNLVALFLDRLQLIGEGSISPLELVTTLGEMPRLSVVYLDLGNLLNDDPEDFGNVVYMPRMLALVMEEMSPDHMHFILSHLFLPRLHYLNIRIKSFPISITYTDIVRTISDVLLHSSSFPPIRVLYLSQTRFYLGSQLGINPDVRIDMESYAFPIRAARHFAGIINTIRDNLNHLMSVTMHCPYLSATKIRQYFGSLPNLQHFTVIATSLAALTRALSIRPDHPDDCTAFPKLYSLFLAKSEASIHHGEVAHVAPKRLEGLRDCLMLRHEYGVAIYRLHLVGFKLEPKDVHLLEEIVVDLGINYDRVFEFSDVVTMTFVD